MAQERDGDEELEPATPAEALKHAAKMAVTAAALGAAVSAARRLGHQDGEDEADDGDGREPDAQEAPAVGTEGARDHDSAAQADDADGDHSPREDQGQEENGPTEPIRDPKRTVEQARRFLRELQGKEAETVSSLSRTGDGWRVALEVLELARIPDSTDVLATYEATIDDDGNLVAFERTRRYRRSQADGGDGG